MAEQMPADLEAAVLALVRVAETGTCAPALSGTSAQVLLRHIADLDKLAARYRWIRTHQYQGDIDAMDPCDAKSPCAIQFDRRIDTLMSECP